MNTNDYFRLFGIKSPYERFRGRSDLKERIRGWTGTHQFLTEIVEKVKPITIIEVGSYLGQSAITMAKEVKRLNLPTTLICVDTWLGSSEHWLNDKCNYLVDFDYFADGISAMYDQFVINMIVNGVDDMVVPIPNTSRNAHHILKWKGVKSDLIYVDASHSKKDVYDDTILYYDLLSPGGVIFGDDYQWTEVKEGSHDAAVTVKNNLTVHYDRFWSIRIPYGEIG